MEYESALAEADRTVFWTNLKEKAPARPWFSAMLRGARFRCPNCGAKSLFTSYLRVADECAACGEELHHQRADDAPPYFTIVIVGHVIVPLLMALELAYAPPLWVHLAIWLPLAVLMCLLLLPRIKGAIVGLQWALRMHGFDKQGGEDASEAGDTPASRVVKAQILPT